MDQDQPNHRLMFKWLTGGSVVALLVVVLTACSAPWRDEPPRAVRPDQTSTPVEQPAPHPGGGLFKPEPVATPVPVDGAALLNLSTAEQLALVVAPTRDLRELAMRFDPTIDEIPLVVNATTPNYNIGDELEFWVHDLEANRNFAITARLLYKTDVAYAWVEIDQPVDEAAVIDAVERFSYTSYPSEVALFGSEWNPGIDNDPRLHILHATGLGSGIAGYYSSVDEYSQLARSFSNEKEIFYINLGWLNSTNNYTYYETVLAHEFQHMIHWQNDRNEETWVNEGLSELAQEVAGFPPNTSFAQTFADMPDTQLNAWGEEPGGNGIHYGSTYLMMAYFNQRFGPALTQALVAQPANGIRGFDAVFAEAGLDMTFNGLFAEWTVANYVDDANALGLDGVYGYRDFSHNAPTLDATYAVYPTEMRQTAVYNYGADYVLLEGEGDVTVHFQGSSAARLADLTAYSGDTMWWSNRGDDFNTRLTRRFDLRAVTPDTPVVMSAALWYDIEDDYDFGYVSVSQDGEYWELLPGTGATTANASSMAFGPGYTSSSDEWFVAEFDLSAYVGQEIDVRFDYVPDDAINTRGWFVDDIAIPAIDYAADFENGADGWESEGWLLTDNRLTQSWLVQVLLLEEDRLVEVTQVAVDSANRADIDIQDLGNGRSAVLVFSGTTLVTTEQANYEYWIDTQ